MRHYLLNAALLMLGLLPLAAGAQSVYMPLNQQVYETIDRYEISQGRLAPQFHSAWKPYYRRAVADFAKSTLADSSRAISRQDRFNLEYLLIDNHEWADTNLQESRRPLWKLYPTKSDAVLLRNRFGQLHISPVLNFAGGVQRGQDRNLNLSTNTRGIEVRGQVDQKVGFYLWLTENQIVYPDYVRNYIYSNGTVPNEAFWKTFKKDGVDFFSARGYFTFNATRHIGIQFGYDKNFIGNGYRSLILSDFAPAATFLKLQTRVGAFQYVNLYAQLKASQRWNSDGVFGSQVIGNKYLSLHHLSVNLGRKVNVGLFEAVIHSRDSSVTPELSYLNPIIFYRALEGYLGSPDNILVGMDIKYLPVRNVMLYGQVNLDEFLLKEIRAKKGWWANKQAAQVGAKYVNVAGVSNLDVQGEINFIRPFTYAHETNYFSYAHYRQPLAHPLGANVLEYVGLVRWQPLPRLTLRAKGIYAKLGEDQLQAGGTTRNFGSDVNRSYLDVKQSGPLEYGYSVGSGSPASLQLAEFDASYMLRHNIWIDFQLAQRTYKSNFAARNRQDLLVTAGIRLNTYWRKNDF